MKLATSLKLVAMLTLASGYARGQETGTELPVTPNTDLFLKIEKVIIKAHTLFGSPLHLVIDGVGPGGG